MFCEKCGNELHEGDIFCEKCGAQVGTVKKIEKGSKKKNKNKIIIGIIIVVVVIIAFAIIGSGNDSSNETDTATTTETTVATQESLVGERSSDFYRTISETSTVAGAKFTVSDAAYSFMNTYPAFFPGDENNLEAMYDMLDWDANYGHISKNISNYDFKLVRFVGYVCDIKEEVIGGRTATLGYITYTDTHDTGLDYNVMFLYDGTIDVYTGDTIELIMLPLSMTTVELSDGSTMDAIFGAASYIHAYTDDLGV